MAALLDRGFHRERLKLVTGSGEVKGTAGIALAGMDRLHDRFVRLCEIPSPTGEERAVADAVLAELRELGVEVTEDDSAQEARAGAGNLIARQPGTDERWVAFTSHLDTVPHEGKVEVALEDGVYRSKGDTILGADNKAAVTVLLELAARHAAAPPPVGLELIFTVAEEDGLRGAKALDVASLRSPFGFVVDHASPIGEVIDAAPTYQRLVAEFEGAEAHAGIKPEAGHSAIAAAAVAVAAMELGRLDEETTANVGIIEGGSASNIVAGHCRIEGEARSIDPERAAATIGSMVDACTWAASEHGCDVDVQVTELFRGYRADSNSTPAKLAVSALESLGIEAKRVATGGGSDANALIVSGFDCVLLANGTEANHTPEERVPAANLDRVLEVCEAIVEQAAKA
jgi:tripeptide aminopeptidase